jgi:hypothetical protein
MQFKITRDGGKNAVVMVWGEIAEESDTRTIIVSPSDLGSNPPAMKLDQVQHTVESGLKIRLGWSADGLILPVEGRGLLNYYQFDSLNASTSGQSLWISSKGTGAFHLVLDLTKIGV